MGGKSSSTRVSIGFDIYGTVLYLFSNRIDVLRSVIVDEVPVWTGAAERGASLNPMVLSTDRGDIYFYWGTDTDPQHPDLLSAENDYGHEHPPYRGFAKIVLQDYYFGRDISGAPNLEIVADSAGAQTVITGTPTDLDDDGQCNPIVCLANYLTDPRQGLGIDPIRLKASTFQTAAGALEADADLKYITMFLTETMNLRDFLQRLVQYVDFYLRFDADGTISVGLYPQNDVVDPAGLEELSFSDFESGELPEMVPPSFDEMGTSFYVTFHDKLRDYKETAISEDNLRLKEMFAEQRSESLDRTWAVRIEQARSLLSEWNRDFTQPRSTGSRVVRRSILESKSLTVGSLFKMSVNPDPDGLALVQVFKLTSREDDAEGLMTEIQFEAVDADSVAVTVAGFIAPSTPSVDVPDLVDARIIELPPALSGGEAFHLGFIAQRPGKGVVGFAVNYGDEIDGFYEMGLQQSFAVKATLDANILAADLSFVVDLDSGALDTDLQELVSPGEIAARADILIAVLVKISAGEIVEDADGFAIMEMASISEFATPGAGQRTLTVLRGRLGTIAKDFLAADTEVWILDSRTLRPFFHNDFLNGTLNPYTFRLVTFNLATRDQVDDYLEIDYNFPTERDYAPVVVTSGVTNNGWLDTLEWEFRFDANVTDVDSDMVSAQLKVTPPSGEPQTYSYIPDEDEAADWDITQTVRFEPEGSYTFDLTVRDANGNVTTDQTVVASGGIPWDYAEVAAFYVTDQDMRTEGSADNMVWILYLVVYAPSNDLSTVLLEKREGVTWSTLNSFTVEPGQKTIFSYLNTLQSDAGIDELRVTATTSHGQVTVDTLTV